MGLKEAFSRRFQKPPAEAQPKLPLTDPHKVTIDDQRLKFIIPDNSFAIASQPSEVVLMVVRNDSPEMERLVIQIPQPTQR